MPDLEKARRRIDKIDAEIAKCFEERLKSVGEIFECKKEYGLDIYDKKREEEIIKKRTAAIKDEYIKKYYTEFLQFTMDISKKYQLDMKGDLHIHHFLFLLLTLYLHQNLLLNTYHLLFLKYCLITL